MRTALTMLGIIIGRRAVGPSSASAPGCYQGHQRSTQSLGTNLVTVSPGATRTGATRGANRSATTLTLDDAQSLVALDNVQRWRPSGAPAKLIVAGSLKRNDAVIGTRRAPARFAYDVWVGSFLNQASVDNNLAWPVIGQRRPTT